MFVVLTAIICEATDIKGEMVKIVSHLSKNRARTLVKENLIAKES